MMGSSLVLVLGSGSDVGHGVEMEDLGVGRMIFSQAGSKRLVIPGSLPLSINEAHHPDSPCL